MDSYTEFYVALGSRNQAKIHAVQLSFDTLFPKIPCVITPVQVDSEVGLQPIGMEPTIQGAITRAKKAFHKTFHKMSNPNYLGIGIEAGLVPVPLTHTGYMDFQFCAIYQPNGTVSIGLGPAFEYPSVVVKKLREDPTHQEIGTIIAELSGIENIKEKEGAIGFLSKDVLKRAEILQYSVIMALLPLKNPRAYSA